MVIAAAAAAVEEFFLIYFFIFSLANSYCLPISCIVSRSLVFLILTTKLFTYAVCLSVFVYAYVRLHWRRDVLLNNNGPPKTHTHTKQFWPTWLDFISFHFISLLSSQRLQLTWFNILSVARHLFGPQPTANLTWILLLLLEFFLFNSTL